MILTRTKRVSPERNAFLSGLNAIQVPPRGVEGTQSSARKPTVPNEGGAESGAVGPETGELISLLASLTPAQRDLLLAIVRAKG